MLVCERKLETIKDPPEYRYVPISRKAIAWWYP